MKESSHTSLGRSDDVTKPHDLSPLLHPLKNVFMTHLFGLLQPEALYHLACTNRFFHQAIRHYCSSAQRKAIRELAYALTTKPAMFHKMAQPGYRSPHIKMALLSGSPGKATGMHHIMLGLEPPTPFNWRSLLATSFTSAPSCLAVKPSRIFLFQYHMNERAIHWYPPKITPSQMNIIAFTCDMSAKSSFAHLKTVIETVKGAEPDSGTIFALIAFNCHKLDQNTAFFLSDIERLAAQHHLDALYQIDDISAENIAPLFDELTARYIAAYHPVRQCHL